jgi:hypothetical protein
MITNRGLFMIFALLQLQCEFKAPHHIAHQWPLHSIVKHTIYCDLSKFLQTLPRNLSLQKWIYYFIKLSHAIPLPGPLGKARLLYISIANQRWSSAQYFAQHHAE